MTTSACNMACRYCFQNDLFPRNRHLQPARGETLVSWTTALADRLRPRTFVLHLYGGEPLLNFERVEPAIVALRAGMLRRGITWQMSLTTNGTLLTRAVADRLSLLGCRVAIISLDGPRAVQNHRRPLRNGRDSFDAVLEGMRNALRRFDVLARVNVDRENAAAAGDLLQELSDSGIAAHPRFFVSLEAVGPILHPTPHVAAHTMSSAESGAVMAALLDRQRHLGIRMFGNMPSEISCEHIMQSALTVDQDGRVYPCPGFAGFSDFCLGDIDTPLGEERQQELSSIRPWEQEPCLSCPYLPQCQGGCKSCAVIVGKGSALENYHRTYCRRPFLDATFPPFLRAMYADDHAHPLPGLPVR